MCLVLVQQLCKMNSEDAALVMHSIYTQRSIGQLYKSAPFQCNLSRGALGLTDGGNSKDGRVDELFVNFTSAFANSQEQQLECPPCNPHNVFMSLSSSSSSSSSANRGKKRAYPSNLQEGIEFASDLALFVSSERASAAKSHVPAVAAAAPSHHQQFASSSSAPSAPSAASSSSSVYSSSSRFVPHASAVHANDASAGAADNPFKSAKDMFVKEGGKLPPSTHAADFITKKVLGSKGGGGGGGGGGEVAGGGSGYVLPDELAHLDKQLVEKIEAEIVHRGQPVTFEDIAGLEAAKKCVVELICWPITRPDLFQGLRALPRGVLLFGPPGTGKTLIGKAIAHQAGATFFSISSSSLMSKWIGEGEKTVRTLFEVAVYRQPSVVFLDEVDSLLCQRSSEENEGSRRMKTEFLVQLDGAGTDQKAQVVIVGATNRPEELDEAARRRFVKRIYIPLPDYEGRKQLILTLLKHNENELTERDLEALVERTDGYSGADIRAFCQEASMMGLREVASRHTGDLRTIQKGEMPPITMSHFEQAKDSVSATVSPLELDRYIKWNDQYGSFKLALRRQRQRKNFLF